MSTPCRDVSDAGKNRRNPLASSLGIARRSRAFATTRCDRSGPDRSILDRSRFDKTTPDGVGADIVRADGGGKHDGSRFDRRHKRGKHRGCRA